MRLRRFLAVVLVASFPLAWIACSKKEEPPPTPTASDDDDEKPKKKKKKKKSDDDEELPEVGAPDEAAEGDGGGLPKVAGKGTSTAKTDSGAKNDADKAKLVACCTALRNAATAAGIASAAASNAMPGMPPPPPKEELDKAVVACDKQVAEWNGDLNASLKKVKGASTAKLPAACYM